MIDIGGYEFKGPYTDPRQIGKWKSGVYVIVDIVDGKPRCVLDIGTSGQIKQRVKGNSRKKCWHENKHGQIGYCVKYTQGSTDVDTYNYAPPAVRKSNDDTRKERLIIEDELFWKYDVPCGTNHWEQKEKAINRYKQYEEMFGPRAQYEL